MARVRISISLEAEDAERIREHADRAGMDVSSYLVNAAIRQMAEVETAEAQFAGLDALIADAEGRAEHYGPVDEAGEESLSEDERREVDEAMRLVHGVGETHDSYRGEVA
ncbi:plasmid mobilization protein [Nocardiopsis lambiniae]|uniref:Ribbon-helix-helix protein, CopG family n=1 Tax=Nocardiopsis lambiniae TaxID=3075539 RepID=A0ABU2MH90_9ACTN|nr:ribbon-helix-helix protein, CopG family [Nocardiopsis sp. DSM 44743]MDT0331900.1 ribbon-helix-helix protein, CopG family [Nocardiopsis sp. DSM 44743]